MQGVPRLLFHGLAEGLILAAVERQPASAQALRERLGRLLDQTPPRDAVEPLLAQLAESDRIRAKPGADGEPRYHLTQEGARRLAAYRRLPGSLAEGFGHLVGADGAADRRADPARGTDPDDTASPAALDGRAWVPAALERLPDRAPVEAPHAEVRLDRDTSTGRWSLEVRGHAPGSCADEDACPLTFLYRAAVGLLYDLDAEPSAEPEASTPTQTPPAQPERP